MRMGDVHVTWLAVVGLHPCRQLSPLLFGDEAVDQQGAAVVTDQGRGGRRPGGRAYRRSETRHCARDGLGIYHEHVKVKAHRTMLTHGTAAGYPQLDCSQIADTPHPRDPASIKPVT